MCRCVIKDRSVGWYVSGFSCRSIFLCVNDTKKFMRFPRLNIWTNQKTFSEFLSYLIVILKSKRRGCFVNFVCLRSYHETTVRITPFLICQGGDVLISSTCWGPPQSSTLPRVNPNPVCENCVDETVLKPLIFVPEQPSWPSFWVY